MRDEHVKWTHVLCWVLTLSQMCFCSGRVPAWDNQERSALTMSSFKVLQQLCWTNKHAGRRAMESLAETVKRCGDGEGREQKMHLFVVVCVITLVCMYAFSLEKRLRAWRGKVCVGDWSAARVSAAADGFDFALCCATLLCGLTCSCVWLRLPRMFLSVCFYSHLVSINSSSFFFFNRTFHTLSAASNRALSRHELLPLSAI